MKSAITPVFKKVLSNGLTLLIKPLTDLPQVSINLWYGVGSKYEKSNQRGYAHLIEHMIFKGTSRLSEVDIDMVTTKLSGHTNAFTSYDYTCYVFDFPSNAWKESFFLLADCMQHCRFESQMLNSELSAVIQELKLYKDDFFDTLLSRMNAAIFKDHPYHYPIIGFKHDLWNADSEALYAFYKKHYVPNNAVLVVVGNVEIDEVVQEAEKQFGHIPKDLSYQKESFYIGKNLTKHSITLYQDIQQPQAAVTFLLPGSQEYPQGRYIYEMLACVLAKGKTSRLYANIVDNLELACEMHCAIDQRQDITMLDITFQPYKKESIETINNLIQEEIQNIIDHGITKEEVKRAYKQVKVSLLSVLESYADQAALIGESFLLTGNENLIFEELAFTNPPEDFVVIVQQLLKDYCLDFRMHQGKIVPMTKPMIKEWKTLQKLSDEEDHALLEHRMRTTPVESPSYALQVSVPEDMDFVFKVPEKRVLSNGATVLYIHNAVVQKIDIILSFAAREYEDPCDKQGLYRFLCEVVLEGTKTYPGNLFAQKVEEYGMTLSCQPGSITLTCLKEDFKDGLMFLADLLVNAELSDASIKKIRHHILSDLKVYWDEPQEFCHQLIRQSVYKNHPYAKDPQGTMSGVNAITKDDITRFYEYAFASEHASLAIVGDIENYDVVKEVEAAFKTWRRPWKSATLYPVLAPVDSLEIAYTINRDQVVLAFAGISITRLDPDYEKLLLFDHIFSGGSSGSMSSRLMRIREQTGLFYGIGGSLIVGCNEQPGMVVIRTTVSLDRLEEAKDVIMHTMYTVINSLTQEELDEAKHTIINGLVDNFSSNKKIAGSYLGIQRFGLPLDYFKTFKDRIAAISLEDVQKAAAKILIPEKMITLKIGRALDDQAG